MVLQGEMELPVWGTASPGEAVAITLGDETVRTIADDLGKWDVKLSAQKRGNRTNLVIRGKDSSLRFTDVLIGEVWIGSGQSNMRLPVWETTNAARELLRANPEIRLFTVGLKSSPIPLEDCEGEWIVCTPENAAWFSAVLYHFGLELHKRLRCPVGLIHSSWNGTPAESWVSWEALEAEPLLKILVDQMKQEDTDYPESMARYGQALLDWSKDANQALDEGRCWPEVPQGPDDPNNHWREAGLFNAMVHPLIPYAIRGVTWYQGEANAGRAYQYRTLFPLLIKDWRDHWGQGDFTFLFVQLANFGERAPQPTESMWAELREAQNMTLSVPNTGMAVTIDIGDADNIHPRNKKEVGRRLALDALAKAYGKPVEYSGPVFESMEICNGQAELTFSHAKGLRTNGGPLTGFAVAGADRVFVWADAVIKGTHVLVSSDEVSCPVAVRYAWGDNPKCNVYNKAGLPASPFRTDDWLGLTYGCE